MPTETWRVSPPPTIPNHTHFTEGLQDYLRYSGQLDENGQRQSTNTDTQGRFHSKWLNMMYPRLFLARNLLREDGVIFVSIDDNEVANLRLLMNDVFGEENLFATLVRRAMHTVRNSARDFNLNADFVLAYAKDKSWFEVDSTRYIRQQVDKTGNYPRDDNDGRGRYKLDPLTARNYYTRYTHTFSNGVEWSAPEGRYPAYSQETLRRFESDNRIVFEGREPRVKRYLNEVQQGQPPDQILSPEHVGFNLDGTKEVADLFGAGGVFSQPKPTALMRHLLLLLDSPNALVLDFFAGSGTTGHAVMKLNQEDSGNRRFILVQLPEPIDGDGPYASIADITRERLRRAGAQLCETNSVRDGQPTLNLDSDTPPPNTASSDVGFRSYHLSSSNFKTWDGDLPADESIARTLELFTDHIQPDRTPEDLLTEIMLASGFALTEHVAVWTLAGKRVYSVAEGTLLVCLEPSISLEVIEAMAERLPPQIICLDSGFGGYDQLKVNAAQIIASRARQHDTTITFKVV